MPADDAADLRAGAARRHATSDELVAVLGADWERAGIALQFLCLVGIGKAIGFFTGPVLFAANRPRFRAVMLWALAALSTATVVLVGELTRAPPSTTRCSGCRCHGRLSSSASSCP